MLKFQKDLVLVLKPHIFGVLIKTIKKNIMKTIAITKSVNSIQVTAKKGEKFEMVKETANSFQILVNGKVRIISKKFAKLDSQIVKEKKKGVIATVIENLKGGSKSKQMLLEILMEEFPEREPASMLKTLNAQLGFGTGKVSRIEKEQKISLKTEKVAGGVLLFEIAL